MNARLFRVGINLWPPFLFTGIHVTRITPDYRQIDVELRLRPWNRNYVGTHFGGSLFAMTDPFWMLGLLHILGRDYYVWDRAGAIDFLKRAGARCAPRSASTTHCWRNCVPKPLAAKVLRWFSNDVIDESGEVVAQVRKQVYLRLKHTYADPERRALSSRHGGSDAPVCACHTAPCPSPPTHLTCHRCGIRRCRPRRPMPLVSSPGLDT